MSPSDSTTMSPADGSDKVRLRIQAEGTFQLDPKNGQWRVVGGQTYLESIPLSWRYSDLMFKLSEKMSSAVSLKYVLPGEALDPDSLISVEDDDDLQEMFEEYFRGLRAPGTPVKTFRLRVLLFPASEGLLTEEELIDGVEFFNSSDRTMRRELSGLRGTSHTVTEKRSSLGSNLSSNSGPTSANTDAAWEAGFRAGQEAAAWAADDGLLGELKAAPVQAPWQQDLGGRLAKVSVMRPHRSRSGATLTSASPRIAGVISPLALKSPTGVLNSHYHTQDPWYNAGDDKDRTDIKVDDLPDHISVFGDTNALGGYLAPSIPGDVPPPALPIPGLAASVIRLPSHISAFGDVEGEEVPELGDVEDGSRCYVGIPPVVPSVVMELPGSLEALQQGSLQPPEGVSRPRRQISSESNSSVAAQIQEVHRVPRSEVAVLGTIGEGAFGECTLAVSSAFGKVAVKWLKPGKLERHMSAFWQEAETLAAVNHPNVLRFYGVVVESASDPTVIGIMTEYMRGGSLSQLLRSGIEFLPLRQRAEMALDVVKGLAYLHEMRVVHFDLKPENLLLDSWDVNAGITVKVADFGLSKHKWKSFVSGVRDLRGTLPYMAPELVSDPDRVSEKADIWSLGMVLWEMLTLEVPFQQLTPQQIIAGLMVGSLHPEVPDWCEPEWRGLMEACLEVAPACRPSLRDVARQLEAIIELV